MNAVTLRGSYDNSSLILKGVMGGTSTDFREFPFQVGLSYDSQYICGGSIISTLFVLTAAHCTHGLLTSKFKVTAGDHNRRMEEGTEQVREVSHIYVHDKYKRSTLENDIALMVLSLPLEFNKNVGKIQFLREASALSGTVTVSGWGQLKEGGSSHHILQKADVPIVPSSKCKEIFHKNNLAIPMDDDVLCAGSEGKDACRGDSGGPLSARKSDGEEHILAGIVSWGLPCQNSSSNLPGVYVNVSKYSKWIETTMMKYGRESGRCKPSEFYCPTDNVCIYNMWVCDLDKDCSNGEDEYESLCSLPCPPNQFKCKGGKCIDNVYVCDGRRDCPEDGEDENACVRGCKVGAVMCPGSEKKCISETSLCDGNHDCEDGFDEKSCTSCHGRGFHCPKDNKCIPWQWKCDSEVDCLLGGEDEQKCGLCLFGLCLNKWF